MTCNGTLLLVQGLAGSGKSHLISMLAKDWYREENFAHPPEDEKKNIEELINELKLGKYCIVAERKYRCNREREQLIERVRQEVPSVSVHIMCFEKNKDAANHNCKHRKNKGNPEGHIDQNEGDINDYEIPDNAVVLKIYKVPESSA